MVSYHFTVKSKQRAAVGHTVNAVCAHKLLKARQSCQDTTSTVIEISLETHLSLLSNNTHLSST